MKKEKPTSKVCKHCKTEIPYEAKVCPQCRRKQGSGCLTKIVIGIVVLLVLGIIFGGDASDNLSEDATKLSKEEYIKGCTEVTYEDLARNPEDNIGKKVMFKGEIQQVVTDTNDGVSEYLISVTEGEYGFWEDNMYVELIPDNKDNKFLEEDIVTFYGESTGEYSYVSIVGQTITIPSATAVYMDLEK